jgi:hypothetical protein
MAKRKRNYDPAKDNPLIEYTPLLIAGAVTGVAGIGYVAYKMSQPSTASNSTPSKGTPTASQTKTVIKTSAPNSVPLKFTPVTTPVVNTSDPATTTPASTLLKSGQTLIPGNSLLSPSGQYELIFQTDSNLVLYNGTVTTAPNAVWSTSTVGKGGTSVIMQSDGNLVMYAGSNAVWATNTAGNPGAYLAVQDDGILAVYTAANLVSYNSYNAIWASTWQ